MPRLHVTAIAIVIAVLVVLQIALPRLAGSRAEDRLTERGGEAAVSVRSWPAVRLLFGGDGDRLRVRARDLDLDPGTRERSLDALDGFGEVDILIEDSKTGPIALREVRIRRKGGDRYEFVLQAAAAPADLLTFAGSRLGPFGGMLGGLAGGSIPAGGVPVPFMLEAAVRSDGGRPDVIESDGNVAGIPLGPLAGVIVGAVAARI